MKVPVDKRLFWFLKEGVELDLTKQSVLDMYVQQVLSKGNSDDIRTLVKNIGVNKLHNSFERIKKFLPYEVSKFWESYFGDYQ